MKNYSFLLLFISLAFSFNIIAQNIKKEPKIDIKVKKEFDDKGNVIKYDSSYSYSLIDSNIVDFSDRDSLLINPFNFPGQDLFSFKHNFFNIDSIFSDPFFKDFNQVQPFFDFNDFQNKIDSLEKNLFVKPNQDKPAIKPKDDNKVRKITL